ncbi:MAG TPA: SPFH domain-containing protein [Hyphomicrobiales bacterium]|nr:SPFH domain-containing protein [Hyphomicrobiales bacterium]
MLDSEVDNLWKKLDALGLDEVRKRLAMGVFGRRKKLVVEEWIRRNEAIPLNDTSKIDIRNTENIITTRHDKFVTYVKNHKILSIAIFAITALVFLTEGYKSAIYIKNQVFSSNDDHQYQRKTDINGKDGGLKVDLVDGTLISFRPFVRYRIKPEDAPKVVSEVGDKPDVESLLDKLLQQHVLRGIEGLSAIQIRANRSKYEKAITQSMSKELSPLGITVLSMSLGQIIESHRSF